MNKSDLEDFLLRGNLNLLPATFVDEKDTLILSQAARLMRNWHDEDLNPSLLFSLLRLPREFKKIRNANHLRRIICAEYFYKKRVLKELNQTGQKRHLFVKLFKTQLVFPFGSKNVLGIIVAFNLLKRREAFEEGHILESVRQIIPNASLIKGSFSDHHDKKNHVHTVYLEIEREDAPYFTLQEIKQFNLCLPRELKGCIEELVPITFMRRNEEEVYRNILSLRDQLKSVKDLPQTTISFEEQSQLDLFFTVVLLRLVKEQTPSLLEILQKEHPDVVFIPDRVDLVGTLRKSYRKEATVFRVQVPKSQFFRKDRSVNLYKARQRVFSMLVQTLGPVRDYNGGLILKQNERLEDFLALTPKLYDEFFQENFFYSITPIAMQSILPAMLIKEWFIAFSELLEKELSRNETYVWLCRRIEEVQLVIVRAENSCFKELLLKEINQLDIPSLELAFSEINMHGIFCFGFLYRPSLVGKDRDFCKLVKMAMERWSQSLGETQALRIDLFGGEPSLDPRISNAHDANLLIPLLFDGLTRIGRGGQMELAIAKSYTASADFKTYTFYLRESKWSNGAPITAYDFEYTWKKSLHPDCPSQFSHLLFLIKNAQRAKEKNASLEDVGVQAVDGQTLVVELEHPAPYFLEAAAHWSYSLISNAIDRKNPDWAYHVGDGYVCNGPFKLREWKHSRSFVVEKNPFYWDAANVKLSKIGITMRERPQSDVGMLHKGNVDMIGGPITPFMSQQEEIQTVSYSLHATLLLCFNTSQFPFNHKKIRQAFGYAINRQQFKEVAAHEYGGESNSLLPGQLSLHNEPLFPNDAAFKAQSLLREGLGEIGFVRSDFPRLSLSVDGSLQRLPLLKMLCAQWKEAFGIDVHLKNLDAGHTSDRLLKGKYQIGCLELNARWGDPLHLLEHFEDKKEGLNVTRWEHPYYQKLLRLAKQAKTLEERDTYLLQAEALLAQHMPAVPLYQLSGAFLKKKTLQDVFFSNTSQLDFKWASIKNG